MNYAKTHMLLKADMNDILFVLIQPAQSFTMMQNATVNVSSINFFIMKLLSSSVTTVVSVSLALSMYNCFESVYNVYSHCHIYGVFHHNLI